jgi:hypothetical protein
MYTRWELGSPFMFTAHPVKEAPQLEERVCHLNEGARSPMQVAGRWPSSFPQHVHLSFEPMQVMLVLFG